uniref:Alpha/beta hydrolase n=1 Tax=Candidatus Kentrum sp. DK TaxID=2126562 RepID=A0A450RUN2_9GAMM|nr:MAG: hypothetical protein BECKDK2373C_GA0170839_100219 [Candidatus Kentron sp. DK]VFJ47028.1 MAG: hypothetical protein BECKDK2373B_GA0170837_101512 [Candidatus Kentron sp. DK]
MHSRKFNGLMGAILAPVLLCSCASVSEGVTTGLYNSLRFNAPAKKCQITGPGFSGISAGMEEGKGHIAKVLVVHGIGSPGPGHSNRLIRNITDKLRLNKTYGPPSLLTLKDRSGENTLGRLSISGYGASDEAPSLMVYELTWSDNTDEARAELAFDTKRYGYLRARMNQSLKAFINEHLADPMVYLGQGQEGIIESVQQAFCWMFQDKDLGEFAEVDQPGYCENDFFSQASDTLVRDDFFIVSHSLGSAITLDAIDALARSHGEKRQDEGKGQSGRPAAEAGKTTIEALRGKSIPFFMLANQLPLLRLFYFPDTARAGPDRYSDYCEAEGDRFDQRFLGGLAIVAFTDPNDLLSYTLEPEFVQRHVSPHVCPRVTNVLLNVAAKIDIVGFANPITAHLEYSADQRVIDLIAHGTKAKSIHNGNPRVIYQDEDGRMESCNWLEMLY